MDDYVNQVRRDENLIEWVKKSESRMLNSKLSILAMSMVNKIFNKLNDLEERISILELQNMGIENPQEVFNQLKIEIKAAEKLENERQNGCN